MNFLFIYIIGILIALILFYVGFDEEINALIDKGYKCTMFCTFMVVGLLSWASVLLILLYYFGDNDNR